MADLTDDEMAAIVTTWRSRTRGACRQQDGVAHVLIFENRGAMVGTSNPHPHCQIYAGSMVYATMAREAEVAGEHHRADRALAAGRGGRAGGGRPPRHQRGRPLLRLRALVRAVRLRGAHPAAAAGDVAGRPRRDQCRSLALVLRDVVRRYDALWGFRLPYVLAVHQAPVGDHPHYPFHLELHPPLRAPGLRKYLAGPEVGGGSDDQRVRPRPEGGGASCRPRLRRPGACSARSATTCATSSWRPGGMDMAAVAGETVADTIYAIDRVADDALVALVRGALARRPGRLRRARRAGARRRRARRGRSSSTPSTAPAA